MPDSYKFLVLGSTLLASVLVAALAFVVVKGLTVKEPMPQLKIVNVQIRLLPTPGTCQNTTGFEPANTGRVYLNPVSIYCMGQFGREPKDERIDFEPDIFVVVRVLKQDNTHVFNGWIKLGLNTQIFDLDEQAEAKTQAEYNKWRCANLDCPWHRYNATLSNVAFTSGFKSMFAQNGK